MSDVTQDLSVWRGGWMNRLVSRPGFQSWASGFFLTKGQARADGAALFDLVQGFVQSQVLMALVELQIFERLRAGPSEVSDLAHATDVPADRMQILLQAGAALGLLKRRRGGAFALARKGAALLGVPGLPEMIRHHRAFYRDLEDPVRLLKGPEQTELADFWPYVFGARGDVPEHVAQIYSNLMTQSQSLVAEDTLRMVSFKGIRHLMDIGGGTGAFIRAVGSRRSDLAFTLFDLPQVVSGADPDKLPKNCKVAQGSFRDDPLPVGADAISLIRVLYDHADSTVEALLRKVFETLPPGGRLIISEPMGGGAKPERSGDVYFAFYTMAMQTGRARSADEIAGFCRRAGFENIHCPPPRRAFVTRVVTAQKPG